MQLEAREGSDQVDAKQYSYRASVNSNIDVLDAMGDLYGPGYNYITARRLFILSMLQIKQLAGKLEVTDLVTVNSWLEK